MVPLVYTSSINGQPTILDYDQFTKNISYLTFSFQKIQLITLSPDDKHVETTDHIKAAVNIFDQEDAEDDSLELLQGAENGRYKVIAKAEPYKNLPVGT